MKEKPGLKRCASPPALPAACPNRCKVALVGTAGFTPPRLPDPNDAGPVVELPDSPHGGCTALAGLAANHSPCPGQTDGTVAPALHDAKTQTTRAPANLPTMNAIRFTHLQPEPKAAPMSNTASTKTDTTAVPNTTARTASAHEPFSTEWRAGLQQQSPKPRKQQCAQQAPPQPQQTAS